MFKPLSVPEKSLCLSLFPLAALTPLIRRCPASGLPLPPLAKYTLANIPSRAFSRAIIHLPSSIHHNFIVPNIISAKRWAPLPQKASASLRTGFRCQRMSSCAFSDDSMRTLISTEP